MSIPTSGEEVIGLELDVRPSGTHGSVRPKLSVGGATKNTALALDDTVINTIKVHLTVLSRSRTNQKAIATLIQEVISARNALEQDPPNSINTRNLQAFKQALEDLQRNIQSRIKKREEYLFDHYDLQTGSLRKNSSQRAKEFLGLASVPGSLSLDDLEKGDPDLNALTEHYNNLEQARQWTISKMQQQATELSSSPTYMPGTGRLTEKSTGSGVRVSWLKRIFNDPAIMQLNEGAPRVIQDEHTQVIQVQFGQSGDRDPRDFNVTDQRGKAEYVQPGRNNDPSQMVYAMAARHPHRTKNIELNAVSEEDAIRLIKGVIQANRQFSFGRGNKITVGSEEYFSGMLNVVAVSYVDKNGKVVTMDVEKNKKHAGEIQKLFAKANKGLKQEAMRSEIDAQQKEVVEEETKKLGKKQKKK